MTTTESPDDVRVTGLFSYPIKSCRAISHDRATLVTTGLPNDRSWMLVDPRHSPQRFITQREQPLLATISAQIVDDGSLRLSREDAPTLTVAMPNSPSALRKAIVWSSDVLALDAGDEAAEWFARALGLASSQVRLVRFHPDEMRRCNPRYAGDSGAHTMFADGYPLLVASEASLADLAQRMGRESANPLPMSRFRPNIVLSGLPAWDEDHVDELTISGTTGAARIRLVKPCVRCAITTTDQMSGARFTEEPLVSLARFRNNPDLGGVTFGWNAIVVDGGAIAVGDAIAVNYRF